jgi:histidine phosphotransfer protein HptB
MDYKARGIDLGLDDGEYRELIELFLETCGSDIQRLQEALAAGDSTQVMQRVHTIKGASSSLGLIDVSAAAECIEEMAQTSKWTDMEQNVKILKARFDAIQAEVRSPFAR